MKSTLQIVFFNVGNGHVMQLQRLQAVDLPIGIQGMSEEINIGLSPHVKVRQTVDPSFHAQDHAVLRLKDSLKRRPTSTKTVVERFLQLLEA